MILTTIEIIALIEVILTIVIAGVIIEVYKRSKRTYNIISCLVALVARNFARVDIEAAETEEEQQELKNKVNDYINQVVTKGYELE